MGWFTMNGYFWTVKIVSPDSPMLVDRTGSLTLATTDPSTRTVYLSSSLQGDILRRVFTHELGHCAMFSFDLLRDIHRMVHPEYWLEAEEWVCNFIADYGPLIFSCLDAIDGNSLRLVA